MWWWPRTPRPRAPSLPEQLRDRAPAGALAASNGIRSSGLVMGSAFHHPRSHGRLPSGGPVPTAPQAAPPSHEQLTVVGLQEGGRCRRSQPCGCRTGGSGEAEGQREGRARVPQDGVWGICGQ